MINKTPICVLASILLLLGGQPNSWAQEKNSQIPSVLQKLPTKPVDYKDVQARIGKQLQKLCQGKSLDEMRCSTEIMHLATAYDMIATAGADQINQLLEKDPRYAKFIPILLQDYLWMQTYLAAGLVGKNTATGIRVLGDIWFKDGESPDFRMYYPLSCGIAAAWSAGNYAGRLQEGENLPHALKRTNPVWRYFFFKKSHKAGVLHKNFGKLKAWEIRFVAGGIWDDASLKFTQEYINLPPSQYHDACWSAEYSGTSEFGDTIQGPLYYSPWSYEMGEAERTIKHGGVCGALSHVGSTAAAARGIPSFPEGQPGHCAYAYRPERGKWLGGFGGPDGGPHNYIFPGEAPSSTTLMENAFANNAKVAATYAYASLAKALDEIKLTKAASQAWEKTLAISPLNFNLQKDYQQFVIKNNLFDTQDWLQYAKKIYLQYKGHGFSAQRLLEEPEKQFLPKLSNSEKLAWFNLANKAIAATPTSWATKYDQVIAKHVKFLNNNNELIEKYLSSALKTHLAEGDGSNFGQALDWGIENFVKKEKSDSFVKILQNALVGNNPKNIDAKKMRGVYSKAILSAEAAHSISAFQVISEAAKSYQEGYGFNQALNIPNGKLVSDKGMLRLSSTSGWDKPCDHINVLRPANGAFHTEKEDKPFAIVELPKTVKLSGILIVKNPGNEQRTKKMTVYRSTDGATWFEVKTNDNTPSQWRIDTPDAPSAKWIKVEANPG